MKIGIISDVHSNVQALKIVLKEFEKNKIDKIICCGDVIGIGLYPEETIQLLMQYKDKLIAVRGNHEQYFLKGMPKEIHDEKVKLSIEQIKSHKWTHNKISETSKKFLESLSLSNYLEVENKKIYITHYPIDKNGKLKKHIKKATLEECNKLFLRNKC